MQYLPLKAQRLCIIAGCQARLDLSSHRLPTLLGSWPSPPCSKRAKSVGVSLTFEVLHASFDVILLAPTPLSSFSLGRTNKLYLPIPIIQNISLHCCLFLSCYLYFFSSFKVTCFQTLRFGMHILLRSIILSVIAFRGPGLFRSLLTFQCKLLSNFCYLQTYFTNMNLSFVDSNVGNHYFKVAHKIVYIVKMVISWHNAWTYTVTIVHSQTSIYISADIVHPS